MPARSSTTIRDEVFQSYRGRGAFAKWRDDVLRIYVDHGFADDPSGVHLKCPPAIEAQVFAMSTDYDVWGTLERVSVPALLVRGAASDALSARDAAEAFRRLPNGKLLTFDGTHMFPMETPEAVAAAILDFARA